MLRLVVVSGPDLGKVFDAADDVETCSIGRAPGSTVRLTDHEVSRRHVSLKHESDGWVVQDTGSTNGTLLNGLPVRRQPLRHGDRLQVGDTCLSVEVAGGPSLDTTAGGTTLGPNVRARVAVGKGGPEELMTDLAAARRGLRLLHEIGGAAARATSAVELARLVAGSLVNLERVDRAVFLLGAGAALEIVASAARVGADADATVPRTVLDRAAEEGAALLCADVRADPRLADSASLQDMDVRSIICVPLLSAGVPLGFLYADTRGERGQFTEQDLRVVATAGEEVALALANLGLREQLLARQRLEQELEYARAIQAAFLPETLPVVRGLSAAARSVPAREVGGDFFALWPVADGAVAVVGDVAGKGMGAALLMARTLAELRAAVAGGAGPAAALDTVNRALAVNMPMGLFVTIVVARCEPSRGRVTIANAGHPLPLLRRAAGRVEAVDAGRAVPVGLAPDTAFVEAAVAVGRGDILLLVSDGVGAEAGAPEPAVILPKAPADPEGIVAAVLAAPDAQPRDDRTALAVRFDTAAGATRDAR